MRRISQKHTLREGGLALVPREPSGVFTMYFGDIRWGR